MNSARALEKLQQNPLKFLRQWPMRIAGHPTVAGPQQYYLFPHGNPGVWSIGTQAPPLAPHRAGFMAWSVPMVYVNAINPGAMSSVEALSNGGPSMIVTGLLNGCTFCIEDAGGGNVRMSHVKPAGGVMAIALQTSLALNGRFAGGGGGPVQTFGMGTEYGGTEDATIVGVREPNGWHIYAQMHTRMAHNILRAEQIYPA